MKKYFLFLLICTVHFGAHAGEILKDFDSLGGNDVLLERAKALNPEVRTNIVQNRIVDLNKRFEIVPDLSLVFGGDSYVDTWLVGVGANFHITPHWALGLKYGYAFNKLTTEGDNMVNNPAPIYSPGGKLIGYYPNIPAVDYIKQEELATVSWSPIYGKMNFFDMGVVHFDVYALGGGGFIDLHSGNTSTFTAGGGLGLWVSQHLTTHFELRWQGYQAQRYEDKKEDMDLTIGSIQFGYLL